LFCTETEDAEFFVGIIYGNVLLGHFFFVWESLDFATDWSNQSLFHGQNNKVRCSGSKIKSAEKEKA
jgi:hypothetical protein